MTKRIRYKDILDDVIRKKFPDMSDDQVEIEVYHTRVLGFKIIIVIVVIACLILILYY